MLSAALTFVGGLGLFLLGMRMMTDGLKLAAGHALQEILRSWTSTRLRGLTSGFVLTAMVQSSSAVTVATIGFVNAGLLTLPEAVWVVFGSNVGTTVTGWLVAVTGLDFDLEAMAIPAVGVGMLLHLSGRARRRGAVGEAIAGFGVFFLGLGVLQGAFEGLGHAQLELLPAGTFASGLLYLAAGAVLTTAVQSSSAAVAVGLSAAIGGVIGLEDAAALVVGANIGTTSTSILASIGATPAARRVAAAHVAFNALAATVALVLLSGTVRLLSWALSSHDAPASPATVLALYHTFFNLLGVLLIWPAGDRLVALLEGRFSDGAEQAGRPRYIDDTVLPVPAVAIQALLREVQHAGELASRLARRALDGEDTGPLRAGFDGLISKIGRFVGQLDRALLPDDAAQMLPDLVRALQRYVGVAELAAAVETCRRQDPAWAREPRTAAFVDATRALLLLADTAQVGFDGEQASEAVGGLEERYRAAVDRLVADTVAGALDAPRMADRVTTLEHVRRLARQMVRAAQQLAPYVSSPTGVSGAPPPDVDGPGTSPESRPAAPAARALAREGAGSE